MMFWFSFPESAVCLFLMPLCVPVFRKIEVASAANFLTRLPSVCCSVGLL